MNCAVDLRIQVDPLAGEEVERRFVHRKPKRFYGGGFLLDMGDGCIKQGEPRLVGIGMFAQVAGLATGMLYLLASKSSAAELMQ